MAFVLNNLQINTKNNGAKKITKTVAKIMPPITEVPIAFRALAPAPVLKTNGSTPNMNAKEVIIIGMDHSFKEKGRASKLETRTQEVDESHCHPDYFPKGIKWQLPDLLRSEIAYQLAQQTFERENKSIIDATINGQCDVFKKTALHDILINHEV